jgi:hypothetical protein
MLILSDDTRADWRDRHGKGVEVSRKAGSKTVQVQRTVVGMVAALALAIGSVTSTPASVAGKPNGLAVPCPPPPKS